MKNIAIFITLFLWLSTHCQASGYEPQNKVIVTASPAPADAIDTAFQVGKVTVIKRAEFEASAASVADVLNQEAGTEVRSVGGIGTFSTISLRGSTSNQVNVYLDGVLLNHAFGGAIDLSQFLLSSVEEIEIYRSNTPVQLGYSGIGGAINIKTRQANSQKSSKQIGIGLGSYKTKKINLFANDQIKDVYILAAAEYLNSDNTYHLLNDNKTPDSPLDDFVDRRHNAEISNRSLLFNASTRLSSGSQVKGLIQHQDKDQQLPDHTNSQLNQAMLSTELTHIQGTLNHWMDSGLNLTSKISILNRDVFFDDHMGTLGVNQNQEKTKTQTHGTGFQLAKGVGNHAFNLNFEWKNERYKLTDEILNTHKKYARKESLMGLQDEWISENARWLIVVGARFLHIRDEDLNVAQKNHQSYQLFQAGLAYELMPHLQVRANLSRDIRVPLLSEKFGDRGYSVGNPNLNAETAINAEFGLSFNQSDFQIASSLFFRNVEDAIVIIFNSRGIGEAQNISKAKVIGAELESDYRINRFLFSKVRMTVQRPRDESDSRQFGEDRNLPGLSEFSNFISLSLKDHDLQFTLEHEYQAGGFYDRRNIRAIKSVNQYNFLAGLAYESHRVEFAIKNITGRERELFNGFPYQGASFFAQYKHTF